MNQAKQRFANCKLGEATDAELEAIADKIASEEEPQAIEEEKEP